jgi:hypothetical protein
MRIAFRSRYAAPWDMTPVLSCWPGCALGAVRAHGLKAVPPGAGQVGKHIPRGPLPKTRATVAVRATQGGQ